MTQHAEATSSPRPMIVTARALLAAHGLWIGVGAIAIAATAFLLHQLMAWPPHEDETLALFVGRDSLGGLVEHVTRERGGAPLHFLLAYGIAHLGFGLGGLRVVSAAFAVASLPLVALLGQRLANRRTALIATALVAGSWVFLFHGVYARMYSLFLFTSLLSFVLLLRALDRGRWLPWLAWGGATLLSVASHPYGALVLAAQAAFVVIARRDRLKQAAIAFGSVFVAATPFWLTDLVLAGRFDVGVGGRGAKLGGPWAIVTYLWQTAGDFSTGRWPALIVVLIVGLVGLVANTGARVVRSRSSCCGVSRCPARWFDLAGIATPHFRPPVLRDSRRSRDRAQHPATPRRGGRPHRGHRHPRWEPNKRQATRAEAERFLAVTSRRDDLLFGYEPLYLGAWERNPSFPSVIVPRADATLALRTLEDQPKPLGRGVWILDASERNNLHPRLEIENRNPGPAGTFETRVFGPFLVIRTREPVKTEDAYLRAAARAMLVGRSLGIGDADVNLQTVERADRVLRGYGPSLRLRSETSR